MQGVRQMQIIEKGSKLCKGCDKDMYGKDCHCVCHKLPMMNGIHEIVWLEGEITIANTEG